VLTHFGARITLSSSLHTHTRTHAHTVQSSQTKKQSFKRCERYEK